MDTNEQVKAKAKIVIIDDHPVVRQGLSRLINPQSDMEVCGEASNATAALKVIASGEPDVAVVDISLNKDLSGIELIKDIKAQYPKVHVLVLSMHSESVFAERTIRAGARGYVMKEEAMEVVLTAIRRIMQGEIYLSDEMARTVLSRVVGARLTGDEPKLTVERLTDRELEVFGLIGRGFGTSEIAEKLYLSVKTIEAHRAHIKEKLNCRDSGELVRYAIQWVQSENVM